MADVLSDDLLKRIAESPGRCYAHEGRAMAHELLLFRARAKEIAAAASATLGAATPNAGQPFPFGLYP